MAKAQKEPLSPPDSCISCYGARDASSDELERLIRDQLPEIPASNAGAHDVWVPRFLAALERSPNWSLAARAAGVDQTTPGKRADSDPEFAAAAAQAEQRALDLIEAAAFKSAVYGDLEPVYHMGVRVGETVKYSDRMRELLLKAGRPEKYRERVTIDTGKALRPALTAEDRRDLVLELLPTLADYARFPKPRPVPESAK
jgi:hypothetical protein